jgi:exopolyphosphatase/guanosine-5'-triphosphate,3'-diphosphate pyrophosphatase
VRSVDVGALVLSTRLLGADPPAAGQLGAARAEVALRFEGIAPPRPQRALAVGGSARGLAPIVGRTLGAGELAAALRIVTGRPSAKLARTFRLDPERARLLPAGALVLAEVVRRLGVPLELARGGVREGAVASLLADELAA